MHIIYAFYTSMSILSSTFLCEATGTFLFRSLPNLYVFVFCHFRFLLCHSRGNGNLFYLILLLFRIPVFYFCRGTMNCTPLCFIIFCSSLGVCNTPLHFFDFVLALLWARCIVPLLPEF